MSIELENIRQIPMFSTLDTEELTNIASMVKERIYQHNEIVLFEGEVNGALYYIKTGSVKIYKISPDGKEQVLRLVNAGGSFNDVPALDGGPNPASVSALETTTLYVIDRDQLHQLILEHPKVAEAVVRTLAQALRHLVSLVEDLSFRRVTARVAKIVIDQAKEQRHLTQQEMAAMAGTAREMVGRALKELESAGAIEVQQGHIHILDSEKLQILSSI